MIPRFGYQIGWIVAPFNVPRGNEGEEHVGGHYANLNTCYQELKILWKRRRMLIIIKKSNWCYKNQLIPLHHFAKHQP